MRLLRTTAQDVRYQARYGFYLIYAVVSVVYVALLHFVPGEALRRTVAALVLLSDPAVLGFFFIGGIWLLERDENLHGYAAITPQRPGEYVAGKALSLGLLSALSALAIALAALPGANLVLLGAAVLAASCFFTLLGLWLATLAKSVNGYLLTSILPAMVLVVPAVLTLFGIQHVAFELFPGTLALRLILAALAGDAAGALPRLLGLALWAALAFFLALRRVAQVLHPKGGTPHAQDP